MFEYVFILRKCYCIFIQVNMMMPSLECMLFFGNLSSLISPVYVCTLFPASDRSLKLVPFSWGAPLRDL